MLSKDMEKVVAECLNCGKIENRIVKTDSLGNFCECECGATFDIENRGGSSEKND